jgi:hypothetical protein
MFARVFALLVVPALVVGLKPHPTYESFLANEVNIEIPQTDSFIQVAQEDMVHFSQTLLNFSHCGSD